MFARLFTGNLDMTGLNASEREQVRRNALITAGLSMLARNAPGTTFGQNLAMGVLMGRQAATETAGSLLDEKQAQREVAQVRSIFENSNLSELEKWQETRRVLVKRGNLEGVRVANDVLKELKKQEEGKAELEFQMVNGTPVFVDKEKGRLFNISGELIREAPQKPEEPADPFEGSFTKDIVLEDGRTHTVLFAKNGQPIRDLGVSSEPPQRGADEPTVKAMERELETIEGLMEQREFQPFGFMEETAAGTDLTRGLSSPEAQQFRAAGANVLSMIILARSGKRATDAEVARLAAFALPQPGDDPSTVRSKLERLRAMVRDLRGGGGGGSSGSVSLPDESDLSDEEIDELLGEGF